MNFVGVELKQLQVAQDQGSDVDFVLCDALVILVVSMLVGRQEAGCSQALEQEQGHKGAVEEILVRPHVRQRSQMINTTVIIRLLSRNEAPVFPFQLLSGHQEIFQLSLCQNPKGHPRQN